jgi:hypothetical protein
MRDSVTASVMSGIRIPRRCWKTNSHDSTVVTQMMGAYNSGFEMLGAPQK